MRRKFLIKQDKSSLYFLFVSWYFLKVIEKKKREYENFNEEICFKKYIYFLRGIDVGVGSEKLFEFFYIGDGKISLYCCVMLL